jgi:hypothetical protein
VFATRIDAASSVFCNQGFYARTTSGANSGSAPVARGTMFSGAVFVAIDQDRWTVDRPEMPQKFFGNVCPLAPVLPYA